MGRVGSPGSCARTDSSAYRACLTQILLIDVGAPVSLIIVGKKLFVPRHKVQQNDTHLVVRVRERTHLPICADRPLLEVLLTVLTLVTQRVVQLLDFVVRVPAHRVATVGLRAHHVVVGVLEGVAPSVGLVVPETAGVVLSGVGVAELAVFGLEGLKVKGEELGEVQAGVVG